MPTYDLANIRLVLAEPSVAVRREMEDVLRGHGFRSILATGNMLPVRDAVLNGDVDLLVGDTVLPEGDISELIRETRHGQLGNNPFLVTITLVGHLDREVMRRVIDSGTDAVLIKPFTADALVERILVLIERRKRFVVTCDYVGPDRRTQARPGTMPVPLVDVPNPLQCRAMGQGDPLRMKRIIENAAGRINEQKVERDAFQIGYLIDRIIPGLNGSGDRQEALVHLDLLAASSRDIARRIRTTRFLPAAAMCLSLVELVERIRANLDLVDEDDLRHLQALPALIGRQVLPSEGPGPGDGKAGVDCQDGEAAPASA